MLDVHTKIAAVTPSEGSVVVVGSANADLTVRVAEMPHPGQTIHGGPLVTLPGGKSANQAAAAALLGSPTAFVGAVGVDDNGDFLLASLGACGVDTSNLHRVKAATSCAIITVDAHGENMIVVTDGANNQVDGAILDSARTALISAKAVGLALEIPVEAVVSAAKTAHEAGAIVVFNPSPMPSSLPQELLANTDVLVVNEGEMRDMIGDVAGDWRLAEERLSALGVGSAVVTIGSRGSVVLADGATLVPVVDVDVVDTTGCGDSFTGALMAALASGRDLLTSAQFASIVASSASMGFGAQASYGTLEQIRTAFDGNHG